MKTKTLSLLFGWRDEPLTQQNPPGGRTLRKLFSSAILSISLMILALTEQVYNKYKIEGASFNIFMTASCNTGLTQLKDMKKINKCQN
jgi:hypothetical protein